MAEAVRLFSTEGTLDDFLPPVLRHVPLGQSDFPAIAKNPGLCAQIEASVQRIPTVQTLMLGDARNVLCSMSSSSVHLVLTSPPYWILKEYPQREGQLGSLEDYELFISELANVWRECYRILVPGGRLIVVVGDVSLKRRVYGKHVTFPLHASIQESCRKLGFDNLTPIIWQKNANASYEVEGKGGFLGKPYEPNSLIKNDIEFILLQRKAGTGGKRRYRSPSLTQRILSIIPEQLHHLWFQPIWHLQGESLRNHPAPFPLELATRLVRMFSFVGDTVADPFFGSGTSVLAAGAWGRQSVGIEIEPHFFNAARFRIATHLPHSSINTIDVFEEN